MVLEQLHKTLPNDTSCAQNTYGNLV